MTRVVHRPKKQQSSWPITILLLALALLLLGLLLVNHHPLASAGATTVSVAWAQLSIGALPLVA